VVSASCPASPPGRRRDQPSKLQTTNEKNGFSVDVFGSSDRLCPRRRSDPGRPARRADEPANAAQPIGCQLHADWNDLRRRVGFSLGMPGNHRARAWAGFGGHHGRSQGACKNSRADGASRKRTDGESRNYRRCRVKGSVRAAEYGPRTGWHDTGLSTPATERGRDGRAIGSPLSRQTIGWSPFDGQQRPWQPCSAYGHGAIKQSCARSASSVKQASFPVQELFVEAFGLSARRGQSLMLRFRCNPKGEVGGARAA